ncbi:hypothetical protein [Pseudomonas moorei]|uniref:Uncharacterized protein n=1 Tax=Pseudomonas moorei TaxID=395599 RepID=A0A1H1FL42_9PSED|nr:hypothetical protein [Pseudomonas moorei]KAB0509633.1 hypothetical protein F7R06_01030 [Pseudomonas moorei]SDR01742.1 hypothetical protein SAMN04490195_2767 [Pseudomonas moorei]
MICRKSMDACKTPGMCSPHGGCQDPIQSELAALREELATLKSPGPLCFCGLKQTKNPHPEAGVPPGYLEVGTVYDCIPCLNKSRRAWSKKANALTSELAEAKQRLADAERRNVELISLLRDAAEYVRHPDYDWHIGFIQEVDAAIKPTESGASE